MGRTARWRTARWWVGALVAALAWPCSAGAATFLEAAVPVGNKGGDLAVGVLNALTGTPAGEAAGVNTPDDELHPSLSADGRYLVFQRNSRSGGTTRIVMFDRRTGVHADLFETFETSALHPIDPVISPDGRRVVTAAAPDSSRQLRIIEIDVSRFPSGPFPKFFHTGGVGCPCGNSHNPAITNDPSQLLFTSDTTLALAGAPVDGFLQEQIFTGAFKNLGAVFGHPAWQPGASNRIAVETIPIDSSSHHLPADLEGFDVAFGQVLPLPALVNSSLDEAMPAYSSDGRYLAFIRHFTGGLSSDRLMVFSIETQTIVNGGGVELGPALGGPNDPMRLDGNVSLISGSFTLTLRPVTFSGQLTVELPPVKLAGSPPTKEVKVGILVERIVGTTQLLGRTVPKLRLIGRVPLGRHRPGRIRLRWDHRVNGRRVPAGRYLITARTLDAEGRVTALSNSRQTVVR